MLAVKKSAGESPEKFRATISIRMYTLHAAMKGATKGMMEYFSENFKNKNTVYTENDEFYDMGHIFTPFEMEDWIERDKKYVTYEAELREKNK